MEVNVLWMTLFFSLTCLYLGFSKDKYIRVVFGILGGAGLILLGFGVATTILYIGWGSPANVITYTLESDSFNASGHSAIGALFVLSGIVIIIFSILIAVWGDDQNEPGEIADKIA